MFSLFNVMFRTMQELQQDLCAHIEPESNFSRIECHSEDDHARKYLVLSNTSIVHGTSQIHMNIK